jgi:hypothetical protein
MRIVACFNLLLWMGCNSTTQEPLPFRDLAQVPDLMCSDFGQPCGFDGYQCCKAGRFPLTCAGGACTMCAEGVGADCSTMPCCDGLTCSASKQCQKP